MASANLFGKSDYTPEETEKVRQAIRAVVAHERLLRERATPKATRVLRMDLSLAQQLQRSRTLIAAANKLLLREPDQKAPDIRAI